MKKRKMKIETYVLSNGMYCVVINNIGYFPKELKKIPLVVEKLTNDNELFFGHYRVDGINLSNSEIKQYGVEIPNFFKTNGRYDYIIKTNHKGKKVAELVVGSISKDEKIYDMLCKIFHYYLVSVFFCPRIDWECFVKIFNEYVQNGTKDYVAKGYTDFLFVYEDSGDFSIQFDPCNCHPETVRMILNEIFNI